VQTFHSKVSYLLVLIVVVATLFPLVLFLLDETTSKEGKLLFPIIMILLLALILYFIFDTKYIIREEKILVKIGFIPYGKIPINTITKIDDIRTILSSPASSFDRMIIHYGTYGSMVISPKSKGKFIKTLKSVNPSIISTVSNGN